MRFALALLLAAVSVCARTPSLLDCVACAAKAGMSRVDACANNDDEVVATGDTAVAGYAGHLHTYKSPILVATEENKAMCDLDSDFPTATSIDVVMVSAARANDEEYLLRVVRAYIDDDPSTRVWVGWDDSKPHAVLAALANEVTALSSPVTLVPLGRVEDPVPAAPPLTAKNFAFGTEARARIQTETVLRMLERVATMSSAAYLLFTEDDFLPCKGFVRDVALDVARIRTDFSSYRCAYGMGCLVMQRTADIFAFVRWARANIAVAPVDTLSSVFFAKEETSRFHGKWNASVADGFVHFGFRRINYVKKALGTVHIGVRSTFSSSFHATTLGTVPTAGCGEAYDTRSPVERDGAMLDKFDDVACGDSFLSPCTRGDYLNVSLVY